MSESELEHVLAREGIPEGKIGSVIDMMIYYGLLVVRREKEIIYIYDLNYDWTKMQFVRNKSGKEYKIHDALAYSLELK